MQPRAGGRGREVAALQCRFALCACRSTRGLVLWLPCSREQQIMIARVVATTGMNLLTQSRRSLILEDRRSLLLHSSTDMHKDWQVCLPHRNAPHSS